MNAISFPRLGLFFKINPVAFSIGSKPIYWYALIILAGFLSAVFFCCKTAKKRGVDPDNLVDIGLYGLIFALICARIYYVIFDWNSFRENLLDVFKVWEGGLAIYGGLIGAVISTAVYCRMKKLNFLKICDVCAPGLFIGQIIGRFGNFVNAEVYGYATDSLLGMSINGAAPVHPLFLYEALWNMTGLIIMLILRDKKKAHGQVICGYFFWYALGRLFLEGMRQPEYILYLIDGVLGISQVVSAALMLGAAVVFLILTKRQKGKAD